MFVPYTDQLAEDQRSIANRLAAAEEQLKSDDNPDDKETAAGKIDPTLPVSNQ